MIIPAFMSVVCDWLLINYSFVNHEAPSSLLRNRISLTRRPDSVNNQLLTGLAHQSGAREKGIHPPQPRSKPGWVPVAAGFVRLPVTPKHCPPSQTQYHGHSRAAQSQDL